MEPAQHDRTRVLVIEDNRSLRETLQFNLERAGYAVEAAADGVEGLEQARRMQPHVILLDLMLPRLDGFALCHILARESAVPIVVLTALSEERHRISGLEQGAVEYIVKPFSMEELLARLHSLLRWGERQRHASPRPSLQVGPVTIEYSSRRVFCGSREIELSQREFDLLACLMHSAGVVLSRDLLLQRVWGSSFERSNRTIDVHIRWLREKLEMDPSDPQLIRTVRGIGYSFALPQAEQRLLSGAAPGSR
jgi:DNA-binding response OmpR family regulator